jgi:hypothetical protein
MIRDGKLFGKINLFDAAILLLIVALIIAGVSKFKRFNDTVDAETPGKIIYTVIINNVRDYTVSAFVSGDVIYDSGTANKIGIVKNVEAKDARMARVLSDGTVKMLDNPYRKDMILTIL